MDPAAPLYPPKTTPAPSPEPQGAAVPAQSVQTTQSVQATPVTQPVQPVETSANSQPAENPATPRPVTSAKAAINAMYAAKKPGTDLQFIPSAREAVNAASRLTPKNFKSAATLHHGSLQKVQRVQSTPKSLESTRTSASALIRTAGADPNEVPVVHTSLKLGANARPKQEPVVLPAGARMARVAQPVMEDELIDAGRLGQSSGGLKVKVIPNGRTQLTSAPRTVAHRIRDPQILGGGRRVLPSKTAAALPASSPAKTLNPGSVRVLNSAPTTQIPVSKPISDVAQKTNPGHPSANNVRSMDVTPTKKLVRPRRFRTAPKNYTVSSAPSVPVDNAYAMSEPPKLAARHRGDARPEDLGVVKNFRPSKLPEPIGDAAPIGRLAEQRVASGHGGPAQAELSIKAENTSNYSFSRRGDKTANLSPYTSANKSPFLKSVSVEKRPLSDSSVPSPISLPQTPEPKPEKSSRKNIYQKKAEADAQAPLPTRPTVIVPSSRRSKAPLVFLIIFTIILGAAVGAAVYLCFFQ